MTATSTHDALHRPLRLWPGVSIAIAVVFTRFVLPPLAPDTMLFAVIAGAAGGLAIALWWLLFSRAPWLERIGVLVLAVAAIAAISQFVHRSVDNGMMGMMLPMFALTIMPPALVAWVALTQRLDRRSRYLACAATMLLVCGGFLAIRTDGVTGAGTSQLAWRWSDTAEERLLARVAEEAPAAAAPAAPPASVAAPATPAALPPAPTTDPAKVAPSATLDKAPAAAVTAPAPSAAAATTPAAPVASRVRNDWPGFRGPRRDAVVRGTHIDLDWTASPPTELWRRPIGPGWSSFAVRGDLLYTQEQRGDEEVVAAYRVTTGEPVWQHRDPVRFWESNGGAGPRGTPTLHDDRVYTFGATGILNVLDAATGNVVWSRDVASDAKRRVPDWGFASSPLIVDDTVIVAAAGTLAAYDRATGERRWLGPSYGGSYSSPHRATIDGVPQILLLGGPGAISVAPADGTVLWKYEWEPGAIVQPAVMADGNVVVNAIAGTGGMGTRRLALTHDAAGWQVEERWSSNGLKPYFNDFVLHDGHAFGFDGSILACITLDDGTRRWKGGRYGNGQLILLADQNVLLVLSEDGELVLVSATADKFTELAKVPALNGKTWNHPALAGDILLVRNGEEMAAFRLPVTQTSTR